jgi:anti-sigma-K factor RskA
MTGHERYREDLALYAVGALTPEENKDLELHLAECPSCREELQGLHAAAAQIVLAVEPVRPPSAFRDQLFATFEARPVGSAGRQADREASHSTPHPPSQRAPWFWVPVFATVLFSVVLLALWKQNRDLTERNRDLAVKLGASQKTLERANELVNALTAADAQRVTLVTTGGKVQPEAKAVYSSRAASLVLLADHLSALPAHKTYELWLLPANGSQPVPAGTFKPDERGSAVLVLSQFGGGIAAKGFAVTVENEPGSSTPTMPIVMSGTV